MKPLRRHIVCATDFSANAQGAADVAAAIATRLRARLILVHVTDEAHVHIVGTKEFRSLVIRMKKRLWKEALRLRFSGAIVEEVVLHGASAGAAIAAFLKKNPPALAITSSVSKTTFDRWTLGSVSERISQRSPVPTLVVRAPQRLLDWTRRERPLNVVVAADFMISSDAPLWWVGELRKVGACAVTVVHVNRALGVTLPSARNPLSLRQRLLGDLRRRIGEVLKGRVDVRVEPGGRDPGVTLVRLAAEADADLLVVGTDQWRGLKRLTHASVSREVLRHAPMNVACVPVSLALETAMVDPNSQP